MVGILRRSGRARAVLAATALFIVLVVSLAWHHYSGRESTDDAQIDAHVNPVAARVGGTMLAVLVADNQKVEKGTLLVRIDPRDYQVALARAEADLAEKEAAARAARTTVPLTSTTAGSQETAADSDLAGAAARLAAAEAQLREAQARERQTARDLERFRPLLDKDEISKQQFDASSTAADSARAVREAAAAWSTARGGRSMPPARAWPRPGRAPSRSRSSRLALPPRRRTSRWRRPPWSRRSSTSPTAS